MRYICAITNIDRSAFFNKNNRNLSPAPAKPYQRKAANHTQNSGFAGTFSFQKTTDQGLSKIWEKMVGHQISIVQKLSFGGSFDSAASLPWQPI